MPSPARPNVLLLGAHGAISLLLTPLLLSRSYNLTSVIRDAAQKSDILALQNDHPGKVDVVVKSLEDVRSEKDAKGVIGNAEWVVWCAGELEFRVWVLEWVRLGKRVWKGIGRTGGMDWCLHFWGI